MGLIVLITVRELIEKASRVKHCPYCGKELDYSRGKGAPKINSPSLDRINNEEILRPDNTQVICLSCNAAKQKKSHAEYSFEVWYR